MTVLILNHSFIKCGVYQFGKRVYELASRSNKVEYIYKDLSSRDDYINIVKHINPEFIIYNWHWDRMPWLSPDFIRGNKDSKHYFIWHDGSTIPAYDKYLFFGALDSDEIISPTRRVLLPRPLFEYNKNYPKNNIFTIGSFGFAFHHKRFPELVTMINKEFNEAIINIHMPNPYFGDTRGNRQLDIIRACEKNMYKSGIKLNIETSFLDDDILLEFLAGNDINVFNYGSLTNPGLSSVFDYALSVKRPIGITGNSMFRHIMKDEIRLDKNSITTIYKRGTKPLEEFYDKWSIDRFTVEMENLFL